MLGDNLPAVDLGTGKTATAIATGNSHTCVLLNDGTVNCWGQNTFGQTGQGTVLTPMDLGTGAAADGIYTGTRHTCARLTTGNIKCWGSNISGRLGLGDTQTRGDMPGEMGDVLPAVKLFSNLW